MNAAQIISDKRDGKELAPECIHWLISEFTAGRVHDYQMTALAMAVYFPLVSAQTASDRPEKRLRDLLCQQAPDFGQIVA